MKWYYSEIIKDDNYVDDEKNTTTNIKNDDKTYEYKYDKDNYYHDRKLLKSGWDIFNHLDG